LVTVLLHYLWHSNLKRSSTTTITTAKAIVNSTTFSATASITIIMESCPAARPRGTKGLAMVMVAVILASPPSSGRLMADSLLGLSEVLYHAKHTRVYLGSPSVLRTANGSLLVSADRFGSGTQPSVHPATHSARHAAHSVPRAPHRWVRILASASISCNCCHHLRTPSNRHSFRSL